jgi:hypothetical protein
MGFSLTTYEWSGFLFLYPVFWLPSFTGKTHSEKTMIERKLEKSK